MQNDDIKRLLVEILALNSNPENLHDSMPLLGHIPEFDSMAAVAVLTAIEERYCIVVDDDEIDASIFETVGSLAAFVARKTSG